MADVRIPGPYDAPARPNGHPPAPAKKMTTAGLRIVQASSFAGKPVPERPWLVRDLIPRRQVTFLSGDGGVGKSLLALQLAVATATATDWIGTVPVPGAVLYLSAEDETDEHHRRIADICAGRDFGLRDLDGLHIIDQSDNEALLLVPGDIKGTLIPTPLVKQVADAIDRLKPGLLIVDTQADTFGGDENNRIHARLFITLLKRWAMAYDMAVVVLAHPSVAGIATGSGSSGSTGWHNTVRSRLYLEAVKGQDGDDEDPNARRLSVKKGNFGPRGGAIPLRWEKGRFVATGGPATASQATAEAAADRTFLAILTRFAAEGRDVSPTPSNVYAPAVFATCPDAMGIKARGFERSMQRLFAAKRISVAVEGPPSKQRRRIVIAPSDTPSD